MMAKSDRFSRDASKKKEPNKDTMTTNARKLVDKVALVTDQFKTELGAYDPRSTQQTETI
jgi:hypothetical protein